MADDFWSTLGAQPTTTAPARTGSAAPSGQGDDAFWSTLGSGQTTDQEKPQEWWQSAAGYTAGLVHAFTHGLSFGLNNPLDRATAALFPNTAFAQQQREREQAQQKFQTDNPIASGTAEVVGSIPTYMMGEGALRAAVPVVQGGGVIGTGANLLGSAVRNAVVSGAQAAGTTEGSAEDRLAAAKQGATVGAIAGPVADVVGSAAGKMFGVAGDVSAADAKLGQVARDKYNIPVTAVDLSGNQFYRTAADQSSKMILSGTAAAEAAKKTAWQKAIAGEMGENATAFTSDVMERAATRIGKAFDDVAARTKIDAPSVNTMVNDFATIDHDMRLALPDATLDPLARQLDNIMNIVTKSNTGEISGDVYQNLTRKGAPLDRAERSGDPNVAHYASLIRDALDDAFVRSAAPADQAALVEAKYQYRIMRTIDQLVAGSRDGSITPAGFMNKVVTASRKFDSPTGGIAYTGGGNIGELAKIGQLMRPAPDSGTAARTLVNSLVLGGAAAPGLLNPAFVVGAPAALAANRVGSAYLRSGIAANRVIEGALNPGAWRPSQVSAAAAASTENALNRPRNQ